MGAAMPKQYLPLAGRPIAVHSLQTLASMTQVGECVVVCEPEWESLFQQACPKGAALRFARPGKERQDSVASGLAQHGAAVLAVRSKATIKEATDATGRFVARTLPRALLWEMQTPQVARPELLAEGFRIVAERGLEVTDDVSVIEHLGRPVCITEGSYTNLKVTTPEDMLVAERLLEGQLAFV
eukprot:jgi/Chlat1/897/Chrsp107S00039